MVLTNKNQEKMINFLIRNFDIRNSIRQIGRKIGISAMGAQKMLKRLEKQQIVAAEKIGTAIYYKLNLSKRMAQKIAELVLTKYKLSPYAQVYAENLEALKNCAKACVMYGSILAMGEQARDVDAMVIIDRRALRKVEKECDRISKKGTKKIHLMIQTEKDLKENIKKGDKAVLAVIRKGVVLWGEGFIVEGIKNAKS